MGLGLVDSVRPCAAAPRPTLEEAELRLLLEGKAVRSASGHSGSWALARPGRWALGENGKGFGIF